MARRRFEMHHYRQALLRMRQGESDREIAAAKRWATTAAQGLPGYAHTILLNPRGVAALPRSVNPLNRRC